MGKIVWKVIKTSCTKVVSSSWEFKKAYKDFNAPLDISLDFFLDSW